MFSLFRQKMGFANALFQGHYVDVKVFYTLQFNVIPAVSFIGELDGSKAFNYLHDRYKYKVTGIYQHTYFDHDKKDIFFNNTLFVFKDKRMIELAANYCHLLHTNKQCNWAHDLVRELSKFRVEAASASDTKVIGFARNNNMN